MASRAREAGVELSASVAEDLPLVIFDPDRLNQVISNLLENAIKFTPRGGQVRVELTDGVQLTVTDTGVGIAPEDLPRLTQPFFRGRTARAVPGSGLGLAIVAELLRRGGGRLGIESKAGEGTRVVVHLPPAGREEG